MQAHFLDADISGSIQNDKHIQLQELTVDNVFDNLTMKISRY